MPTLNDFELSNFCKSHIVAIENKIPYVKSVQQGRLKVCPIPIYKP